MAYSTQLPLPTTTTFAGTTGQITIPAGAVAWSISLVSGAALVGGVGPAVAPFSVSSSNQVVTPIVVSGVNTAVHLVVKYEVAAAPAASTF